MNGRVWMGKIVRLQRGGQITIPAAFRRHLGIDENTVLRVVLDGDELRIKAPSRSRREEGDQGSGRHCTTYVCARYVWDPSSRLIPRAAEVNADIDAAIAGRYEAEQSGPNGRAQAVPDTIVLEFAA